MEIADSVENQPFLSGGGEMGHQIRAYDWRATPLGTFDSWPPNLRAMVGVCLNAAFPMLLSCGKDFVSLYNDAFLSVLRTDRHPHFLGIPIRDAWPEIWHILDPMFQHVLREKESAVREHQPVLLHRGEDPQECYFTFTCNPIFEDSGFITGIVTTAIETTREVVSSRRLRLLNALTFDPSRRDNYDDVCAEILDVIRQDPEDFPFAMIYIADDTLHCMRLAGKSDPALDSVEQIFIESNSPDPWQIRQAIRTGKECILDGIPGLDHRPWRSGMHRANSALVYPLNDRDSRVPVGALVIGLTSPGGIEESDREFIRMFADRVADELVWYRLRPYKQVGMLDTAILRSRAEELLSDVFEQAPVRICFLRGPDFIVEHANRLMLDFWDKRREQIIHKPLHEGFPEMQAQGFLDRLRKVYEHGERFSAEEIPLQIVRNGTPEQKFVSFVYEPFKDLNGNVIAIVVVGHDVTELVAARMGAQKNADEFERLVLERTTELMNKNQELIDKNAELEQFTFLASHDLQEPLRKLQTFAGLLMYNIQDQHAVGKYVNKMVSSVSRMSSLIKSLLDYTNVSQEVNINKPVDLNNLLRNTVEDLELLISERSAIIHATSLPHVHGHPRQLGQLFFHLINNAIKFAHKNPVIAISSRKVHDPEKALLRLSGDRDFICVTFKDNGIGFEQHHSQKVFEIFKRLHHSSDYPGIGIGLPLCKKIVENHHGAITTESKVGEGSKFHVYLPR